MIGSLGGIQKAHLTVNTRVAKSEERRWWWLYFTHHQSKVKRALVALRLNDDHDPPFTCRPFFFFFLFFYFNLFLLFKLVPGLSRTLNLNGASSLRGDRGKKMRRRGDVGRPTDRKYNSNNRGPHFSRSFVRSFVRSLARWEAAEPFLIVGI